MRGGLFDPNLSSTFETRDNVADAGASESDTDRTAGVHVWESAWGVENFAVGDVMLEKYPIGMPGFDVGKEYHRQGYLGLGFNSTILTALKDAGHIASRSYGYWWGLDGATQHSQMDGAIVFGGYDAAKASGPNLTSRLVAPTVACPSGMQLTIADIKLTFPNGTRSSIVFPSSALAACMRIDFPVTITMATDPYYNNFMRDTNTFSYGRSWGLHWLGALFDPNQV